MSMIDAHDRAMKAAEQQRSEAWFRALMAESPLSTQVFAPDGRTIQVNRAWEKLWGATLEQVADYNVLEDPQLEARGIAGYIRRGFAGEALAIPAVWYDPNETLADSSARRDSRRWVRAFIHPIRSGSGEITEVVLIHEDMTDQKLVEERLRESEEQFRGIVAHSIAGVAEVDLTGKFVFVNDRYSQIVGRPADELMRLTMQEISHPDEIGDNMRLFDRMRRDGTPYIIEKRYLRPDGSHVWVNNSVSGLRGRDGRLKGVVAVCVDVTDRRRAEDALREADRRKTEFLATLAHELRNPLAPIMHGLKLLQIGDGDPTVQTEVRDIMDRQLQQLVRLVDDLLDISRISRNRLELRKELIDVAAVVHSALETSRPYIDGFGHRSIVHLPEEPAYVQADFTRLAQVVSNLLTNAAKYSNRGGQISVSVMQQDGEVVIAVQDNGIGIAAEHLPQLFEMFSQVGTALERSQGGLGIGLALVRGLVEMHGGTVEARSPGLGQGSEFVVRLPRAAVKPGPQPAARPPVGTASSQPRRRVLVVDDNEDSAMTLSAVVHRVGHDTLVAHDGLSALDAASTFQPDVVLLDIGMPRMNGYDVARRLRQQDWGKKLTLVAVTGWGQDEDKRQAEGAGFDHHLTKPLDFAVLRSILEAHED